MKIGVNLIQYIDVQGIEVFAYSILRELVSLRGEDDFVFFVNEKSRKIFDFPDVKNIRYVLVPIKRFDKLSLILTQQFSLTKFLNKEKIGALYCPSIAFPFFYKNKIVTIHDCAWARFNNEVGFISRVYIELAMWFAKHMSRKIVTISDFSKREIAEIYNINSQNIDVVYEGAPILPNISGNIISKFPIIKNGIVEQYFFYVGNFHPRKNLKRVIQAFERFVSENKDFYFIIAGKNKGETFNEIFEEVRKRKLEEKVLFVGRVTDEEKVALYKSSRGLVFVSLYEGFGLPVLEAQELGIPVLASLGSSLPEVAGNGAVFADPYSIDAIYNGMKRLLSLETTEEIVQKGRENTKRFSWNKSAKLLAMALGLEE